MRKAKGKGPVASLVLALAFAFAFPASAYAVTPLISGDPWGSCGGEHVHTIEMDAGNFWLAGQSNTKTANVGDSSGANPTPCYMLAQGQTTASLTAVYSRAGLTNDLRYVDYTFSYEWHANAARPVDTLIFRPSDATVFYACDGPARNNRGGHDGGAYVLMTFSMTYSAGDPQAGQAVPGFVKMNYRDLDRPAGTYTTVVETYKDSNGKTKTRTKTVESEDFGAAYSEAVVLRAGYADGVYFGSGVHGTLALDSYNSYPRIRASHVCSAGNPCSQAVVLATHGYQCTFRGNRGAGTPTGPSAEYYVRYNPNGATGGSTPGQWCLYGATYYHAQCGYQKLPGYRFAQWAALPWLRGTVPPGSPFASYSLVPGGIVDFHAAWDPNPYYIRYEGMEGVDKTGKAFPSEAVYDSAFTVSNPTRSGYRFDGWTITGMDANPHLIGATATSATAFGPTREQTYKNLHASSGTVTFTAAWTPVTNLVLHVDDTRGVWRTVEVENYGQAIGVPGDVTEAARKGNCHYRDGTQGLEAWFEDVGYSRGFEAKPLPLGDYHLYGRNWSCITFSHGAESRPDVEYTGVSNGVTGDIATASGSPAYLEMPYAESRSLPEPTSKRVTYDGGYGFPSTLRAVAGWFKSVDLMGAPATRWVSSGDATLYKKWDASITDGALSGRG